MFVIIGLVVLFGCVFGFYILHHGPMAPIIEATPTEMGIILGAGIGAMIIGQWPEAAVVIWLFGVAELIEALSLERARNAIRSLVELAPETAHVRTGDNTTTETPAGEVVLGAIVLIRPGERVPLDGIVVAGSSSVNQAPITGESIPVDKAPGDPVFAATINETGELEFRVTAIAANTTLARIIHAVESVFAQDYAGRIQLLIGVDKASGPKETLLEVLSRRPPNLSAMMLELPYSTSVRHGGLHNATDGGSLRAILSLAANTPYVAYLDDDNAWRPNHVNFFWQIEKKITYQK